MKKFFILSVILLTVVTFSSCKKEGVYTPDKKISKIYKAKLQKIENLTLTTEERTEKYLAESWEWSGNLLKRIETYNSDGDLGIIFDFYYDGKRLSKIEYDGYRASYEYDGRKLNKIEYFLNDERYCYCDVKHDGKKISEFDFHYLEDFSKRSSVSNIDKMVDISLFMFLPTPEDSKRIRAAHKNATKLGTTMSDYNIKLEWDGDNIDKLTYKTLDWIYISRYSYDDKINPYFGLINSSYDGEYVNTTSLCNKNNVTKEMLKYTSGSLTGETYVTDNTYDYDGNWPTKKTETFIEQEGPNTYTSYYYTYYVYKD